MTNSTPSLADDFTLAGTTINIKRLGYGAMQLAGPRVWGPPRDADAAVAVLREALALGVNHIDTSDFYGPHTTNQLIRRALSPYAEGLVIVTKIGYGRGDDGAWLVARSAEELTDAVHDNLRNLGVDALDVVNLRLPDEPGSMGEAIEAPLAVLTDLKRRGLVRHIGLSNIKPEHLAAAERITPIVCVQNQYNLAHRDDDAFIDELAKRGVAFVPFFPLGGFAPLQSSVLKQAAAELAINPMQLALAWLLQRAPNILLIPGTSSLGHLRENLAAGEVTIPPEMLARLDEIGAK